MQMHECATEDARMTSVEFAKEHLYGIRLVVK